MTAMTPNDDHSHDQNSHDQLRTKPVACVFCNSTDTEEFSLYGQTLMGSQYYCNQCRSIFEVIRYDDDLDILQDPPEEGHSA